MSDASSVFVLPPGLTLPPELAGDKPRPLTEVVAYGPLAQTRRDVFWLCLVVGAICLTFNALPFVDELALYVLPLGYLRWIGIALCVIAASSYFFADELKKASRYVQHGDAAFGQVVELVKYPSVIVNGQPTAFAFRAMVRVLHPDTDAPVALRVKSRDFPTHLKDGVETRFRVGDFVPVVWLPGKFEKSLQIYDFLELMPEAGLLRTGGAVKTPLWQRIALAAATPLFLFILFWNVYAFGRFHPLDFDYLNSGFWPLVTGATLALAGTIGGWFAARRQKKKAQEKNREAASSGKAIELASHGGPIRRFLFGMVMAAGGVLLGAGTCLCWCFTANALLDNSPTKVVPVEITEMLEVSDSFLLCKYELKYRRAGKDRDDSLLTTPQHLSEFVVPQGLARVRQGRFGWPWVQTIDPVFVANGGDEE